LLDDLVAVETMSRGQGEQLDHPSSPVVLAPTETRNPPSNRIRIVSSSRFIFLVSIKHAGSMRPGFAL
jgi:hypothetical protein